MGNRKKNLNWGEGQHSKDKCGGCLYLFSAGQQGRGAGSGGHLAWEEGYAAGFLSVEKGGVNF